MDTKDFAGKIGDHFLLLSCEVFVPFDDKVGVSQFLFEVLLDDIEAIVVVLILWLARHRVHRQKFAVAKKLQLGSRIIFGHPLEQHSPLLRHRINLNFLSLLV